MSDMEFMKAEEGDLISLLERVNTSEVPKKIMKITMKLSKQTTNMN